MFAGKNLRMTKKASRADYMCARPLNVKSFYHGLTETRETTRGRRWHPVKYKKCV